MNDQSSPKRTVAGIPSGGRQDFCNYRQVKPFRPCLERGSYELRVNVAGSEKRKPYTIRYHYCDKHVPQLGKRPLTPVSAPPDALGAQEVADLIGIPIMTLHQWRGRGKGPKSIKVGRRCWYSREEVNRYAEAYRIVKGQ